MRMKHVWDYVRIPAKLRLFWDRVTFSKITIIYFIFSILHALIQVIFQVQAFTINATAAKFLNGIIVQGNATQSGFAVLGPDLRMCDDVPNVVDASSCPVVWGGKGSNNAAVPVVQSAMADYNSSVYSSVISTSSDLLSIPSSLPAVSSAISSSLISSGLLSAAASSIPSVSASSSVFSSAVLSSSPAPIASSSIVSPSVSSSSAAPIASRSTVTVTVRPTASTNLESAVVKPTASITTLTVVIKEATPTATVKANEDEEEHGFHKRDASPQVVGAVLTGGQVQVKIDGLPGIDEATLDEECLLALNWPVSIVDNTKREDIVFICFQIWVLGMSLVALLNESIPHIFASLLTHVLATAWGGFQIFNTNQFRADFNRLTTHGACGINLLPTYWKGRAHAEIPSLALNAVALVISAFLTWRLMKLFGWQTFKRIGASLTINRVYTAVLVLSIVIQLSLFFIVVSGALWIDQVYNGNIGRLTPRPALYTGIIILVLVLLIPWLWTGWISVRREYKIPMLIFLILSFLYLVGWSAMFASNTFRWTFVQWRFFSIMATASVFLALVTFLLGLYCRMNFGKGLVRYLNAQEPLDDEFVPATPYDFEKDDVEKVSFPSNSAPIPTFSATFGRGLEVPPPSQMFAPRTMGPRFYASNQDPFDSQPDVSPVTAPSRSLLPTLSYHTAERPLIRQGSGSSQLSTSSSHSKSSSSSSGHTQQSKRWIIE